ncbi:hypothetical protein PPERSA_10650 [Pseudocohnilembus persalinus]|uniref:Armadillo-type fold n=1 Tax=Pseudocohnilembus persalinus TaxID=266149 RepID=A0A0V0QD62_PSEPJ|nr:hypothetical protein PPERSA_10650 [Pseudocohnilembus persalinus]|eukprot:KRX00151.1 hypothetical protein PPERSA_10650 [Pseudocohnilembus persalinus]
MKLDQYEQLVKYVIEMPEDDQDRERAFKFPYVACELLTAEIKQVYDMFLQYEPRDEENNESDNDYDFDHDEKNKYASHQSDDDSDQPSRISITNKNDYKQVISQMSQEEKLQKMQRIQEFQLTHSPERIYNMFKELEAKYEEIEKKNHKLEQRSNKLEHQLEIKNKTIKQLRESNSDLKEENKQTQREKIDLQKQLKKAQKLQQQSAQTQSLQEEEKEQESEEEIFDPETAEKKGQYLLSLLFSFLQTKQRVNITLAGYFSKVLVSLISKKEKEVVQYVYSKPAILKSLCRQNQARSISIILYKLLSFENKLDNDKQYLDERIEVLKYITKLINDPKTDEEERANCTFVIGETIGKWQQTVAGQQIINFIINELSQKWLDGLNSTENQVVYQNCVLLTILLNQIKSFKEQRQEDYDISIGDHVINDEILVENIKNKIKEALDLLLEQPKGSIQTQYNRNLQPLGQTKIKLISFIQVLINQENLEFDCELASNDVFGKLLDLFQQYEWNNVLHNLVTEIIMKTLDKQNVTLLRNLFEEAQLITILNKCTENLYSNDNPDTNKKAFRKGYLGHIYKIGYTIQKIMENDSSFKNDYIQKYNKDWQAFQKQFFKTQKDKNEKELGGNNTSSIDENNSDEDTPNGPSYNEDDIQKKYNNFISDSDSSKDNDNSSGEIQPENQEDDWEKEWQLQNVKSEVDQEKNNENKFEEFDKEIEINNEKQLKEQMQQEDQSNNQEDKQDQNNQNIMEEEVQEDKEINQQQDQEEREEEDEEEREEERDDDENEEEKEEEKERELENFQDQEIKQEEQKSNNIDQIQQEQQQQIEEDNTESNNEKEYKENQQQNDQKEEKTNNNDNDDIKEQEQQTQTNAEDEQVQQKQSDNEKTEQVDVQQEQQQ